MAGTETMKVGAVDIGTNTVRLLVAEVVGGTIVEELAHHAIVTRLGQGVDEQGALHGDAVGRTVDVLTRYGATMDDLGVEARRIIATSATRDASNAAEFLDAAGAVLGRRPEMISGAEEAGLAFSGAQLGRAGRGGVLVIDLGGGSTEFVFGHTEPVYARSVDIGSVRLTERLLPTAPALPGDVARAAEHVASLFGEALQLPPVDEVIGVAGTFTTLGALNLGLVAYDRAAVDNSVLTIDVLDGLIDRLATMTVDQIAALPSMHPGRAPVVLGGAVVAREAIAVSGCRELTVSENDILHGVAMSIPG